MHDNLNLSFEKVQYLFTHSHSLTTDKAQTCNITFWQDESRQHALAAFEFPAWIAHFGILGGGGSNHLLMVRFQPRVSGKQYLDMSLGN